MTTSEDKARLRRQARAVRRAAASADGAPQARQDWGRAIRDAVLTAYSDVTGVPTASGPLRAPTVAVYQSLPTEPPTDSLIGALLRRGVRVIVPVTLPDKDLDWAPLMDDASRGVVLGVEAIAEAALVVVPALTVDLWGARLGQGGGSYDRALARLPLAISTVAIVFDEEISHSPVPSEPHDLPVRAVITPSSGWRALGRDHDPRADLGE